MMKTTFAFAKLRHVALLLLLLFSPLAATAQSTPYGDVNHDGEVTVADVNYVIDIILGGTGDHQAADVNHDNEVTIADINAIIDIILNIRPQSLCSTMLVTTRDGKTTEHFIDQNTRVSIDKPNLILETGGKTWAYDLENLARVRYGQRFVSSALDAPYVLYDEGISPDSDERPQYALFTYRNDGGMNAFLNIDVDSITFSTTDLSGLSHPNAVVQQVWTPDSLYRIPLAAIDSVGFRAPEPIFKDDVFHLRGWHIPYVLQSDGLTLYLSRDIAKDSIPMIGQVVISDVIDEPLNRGFSGRVVSIGLTTDAYVISCEPVALNEIFERLVLVGRSESFTPEEFRLLQQRLISGSNRSSYEDDWDGVLPFELDKFKMNIPSVEGFMSNISSDMTLGSIAVEPKFYVSYIVDIRPFVHSHVKVLFENRTKTTVESHLKVNGESSYTDTKKASVYLTKVPIPIVPGVLYGEVALSGNLYLKGDLDLKAMFTKSIYNGDEYEWSTSDFWNLIHNRYDKDPRIKGTEGDVSDNSNQWESEVVFSVNGSFGFGLSLELVLFAVSENTLEIMNETSVGPELSGSLSFSSQGLEDGTLYSTLKGTKVSFVPLKLSDDVKFNICMRNFTLGGWSHDFGKKDYKLFPDFTAPDLPSKEMYTNEGYMPLGLYTRVTNDVLPILPLKIGIGRYDEYGNLIDEEFASQFYQNEQDWKNNWLNYNISDLPTGSTYTFNPLIRLWGLQALQLKAMPQKAFTMPFPVSLDFQTLQIQKGESHRININGGWGDYSIDNSDPSKCQAELKYEEDGSCYIQVVGLSDGTSTITVKDLRSGNVATVLVTVGDGQPSALIVVSPSEVDFGDVLVGYSPTQLLEIDNSSSVPQTVTVEVTSPFSIAHNESSMSSLTVEVAPNSCYPVTIMFPALSEGDYLGTATFTSNAIEGGSITVPLHGHAVSGQPSSLAVSTTEIDFGVVKLGTDQQKTLTVTNTSDASVTFKVDASTMYTGRFEVSDNLEDVTLASGDSKIYTVTSHGQESGYDFYTEVYVIHQSGDTAATVKLLSIGDDDKPLIGQTSLILSVGESATVHAKTSHLTSEADVEGIVDYFGHSDATGGGRIDGHHSISTQSSLDITFRGLKAGVTTITFRHELTGETATLKITVFGADDNHEWVDLGLPSGTLWATCNVGASAPEDYGDYFAWGETAPKDYYDWSTYKWCNGSYMTMTKYCTDSSYGYNGFTDGKTELDPEDDAAHVNWGPSWRMPTTEQQRELCEKCSSTWTTLNGVSGRLFTGPNGNTLFLPAAGGRWYESLYDVGSYGYYWSRTLFYYNYCASRLGFDSGVWGTWEGYLRIRGHAVRAVRVSQN